MHISLSLIWKLPSLNSISSSLSWFDFHDWFQNFLAFFPVPSWLYYFTVSIANSSASIWLRTRFSSLLLLSAEIFLSSHMVFITTYVLIKQNLNSQCSLLVLAFPFECSTGVLNLMSLKLNYFFLSSSVFPISIKFHKTMFCSKYLESSRFFSFFTLHNQSISKSQ